MLNMVGEADNGSEMCFSMLVWFFNGFSVYGSVERLWAGVGTCCAGLEALAFIV